VEVESLKTLKAAVKRSFIALAIGLYHDILEAFFIISIADSSEKPLRG